jgi:hypothetical protein
MGAELTSPIARAVRYARLRLGNFSGRGSRTGSFALRVLIASVVLCAWERDAHAYAWMIRHGYGECSACHTDPMGGEGLTHMGRVQSQVLLSQSWSGRPELSQSAKAGYALDEPDWLRLGGSVRGLAFVKLPHTQQAAEAKAFPMQMDLYSTAYVGHLRAGLSLGYARIPENSPHLRAAQVFQRESGPNLLSRSHWLGWALAERWLIRGGRLNLPFGLRISEHVQWVRELTKTDRESDQQDGLAISHTGPLWRGELMAVAGNLQVQPDAVRERGYVGFLEYRAAASLAVGASSEWLHSQESIWAGRTEPTTRQAHGATLRWSPSKPWVLMAEANALLSTGRDLGYVGLLALDWEPVQGLHLALSEELADAGSLEQQAALPGAGKTTSGTWLSAHWFFLTHWDLQLDFVSRYSVAPTLQAQLHFYL